MIRSLLGDTIPASMWWSNGSPLCAIGVIREFFKVVTKPYIFSDNLVSCLDSVGAVHADILGVGEPPACGGFLG
ncbi:hypothetical protein RBB50_006033 [Rhinocladiella similis]